MRTTFASLFLAMGLLAGCDFNGHITPNLECKSTCDQDKTDCHKSCDEQCVNPNGDQDEACDTDCIKTCDKTFDDCTVSCDSND